jgi:hypothetical protein
LKGHLFQPTCVSPASILRNYQSFKSSLISHPRDPHRPISGPSELPEIERRFINMRAIIPCVISTPS